MIEPLFVQVPPVWTGPAPWPSSWLPQTVSSVSPLPLPNPAVMGALAPQTPVGSASTLVAAVAMRRGQPNGPTSDQDVEELIYDTLELLPGANDVEARCEGGRVTLSGTVSHKRLKRDIGEIAWSIPSLVDVMNTVTITSRRRTRGFAREGESAVPAAGRKQA
jgi:hypothetical protein